MTRLAIYGVLIAALAAAGWAGISHITGTFAERDALAARVAALEQQIKDKDAAIEYAQAALDLARTETAIAIAEADRERTLRTEVAKAAAQKERKTREALDLALDQIARMGSSSPAFAGCMQLPLPGGVLVGPAEAVPTTTVSGYPRDSAGGVPAADAGAGDSPRLVVGDGLILGQHYQAAFRRCEADKAAVREWLAAQ